MSEKDNYVAVEGSNHHKLAKEYDKNDGNVKGANCMRCWEKGSYVTYKSLNFGSKGDVRAIKVIFAKGNEGGEVRVKLGKEGKDGTEIAKFFPCNTGGWGSYKIGYFTIKKNDIVGVYDLTFVGTKDVFNFKSFELLKYSSTGKFYASFTTLVVLVHAKPSYITLSNIVLRIIYSYNL